MRGVCQFAAPGQDALVSVVAAAGADVIVAATAPGAMLTPWRNEVQVLCTELAQHATKHIIKLLSFYFRLFCMDFFLVRSMVMP